MRVPKGALLSLLPFRRPTRAGASGGCFP